MNSRDVVQRLRAYQQGHPLPRGATIHHAVADDSDVLIVSFVRMGGESRPWGIAYGHPSAKPTILTVPEGRNRDLVADMCAEFAPALLKHLRTPGYVVGPPAEWEDLRPLQQIWLPNASHLDMLHHLAYAYTFTKWGAGKRGRLNAFGRACGWLFREAQRVGEQSVLVATDALRDAFTFPSQDMRQGHLGYLLAWLEPDGSGATRSATASEAERSSMSASLDPELERKAEKAVDAWAAARTSGAETEMTKQADAVHKLLEPELLRRFDLVEEAIDVLRNDSRRTNVGVGTLVDEGLKEQWYQHTRSEMKVDSDVDGPPFFASPETDRSPAAAGSRYQVYLSSAELHGALLLHDDVELQAEAIAAGDAFRGTIEAVWDEEPGRGTRPVWRIRDPLAGPMRLRVGSRVCVVGLPSRTAEIRSLQDQADGTRLVDIEIIGWKTKPDSATDQDHVGKTLTLVADSGAGISRVKSMRIWSTEGPGAWLTHARPGGPRTEVVEEAAEDLTATTLEAADV